MRFRLARSALALLLFAVHSEVRAQTFDTPDYFARLRDMPIGSDGRLTFSGEVRERFESYQSPGFALRNFTLDQYLLQRIHFGADLHVGQHFRTFVQLSHIVQAGRNPVTPLDQNHLDFHQAFLEIGLPVSASFAPTMRAGRQEIALGTQRLVSNKDGPNVRRAFDGFRLLGHVSEVAVNLLATRPVFIRDTMSFDDYPDPAQSLWGLYATTPVPPVPGLRADLYYLGFQNLQAVYNGVTGNELRHSIGTRLFGTAWRFDYNFEATYQFGTFNQLQIAAGMAASDTGLTLPELPWRPRLGLKANYYSGNPQRGGRTLGTFNPLFPRLHRETFLIVTANYYDFMPTLRLHPTDSVTIEVGWDFLWRSSTQDALYGPPFVAYPRTAQSTGASIGNQIGFDVAWQVHRNLTLSVAYFHFTAGETIKQAGGSDVDFFMGQMSFKF